MEKLAKKLTKWLLNRSLHEAIPGTQALSGLCWGFPWFDLKISTGQDSLPFTVLISISKISFQETPRCWREDKCGCSQSWESSPGPVYKDDPSPSLQGQSRVERRLLWGSAGLGGPEEEERQDQREKAPNSDLTLPWFVRQTSGNTGFLRKTHQALNPTFKRKLKSSMSVETNYILTPSENLPTT